MKIIHFFSDPGYGGSEKYAYYVSREAIKEGHEILFVVDGEGPLTELLKGARIKYQTIKVSQHWLPLRYIMGVARFRKIVKNYAPDVVHSHFLRENIVASVSGLLGSQYLLVRTIHRLDRFNTLGQKATRRIVNRLTDWFVAPSEYAAKIFATNGYREQKIKVIYNGAEEIKASAVKKGKVGMLSRLEKGKGVMELIEQLPAGFAEFEIIIAGDGELSKKIEAIIEEKDLKAVTMLGRVDDLQKFFSEIDILIHPSLNESTLPMAAVESLAAGKEVVTFNIEPLKEFEIPGLIKLAPEDWDGLVGRVKAELIKPTSHEAEIRQYFRANLSSRALWQNLKKLYQTPGL